MRPIPTVFLLASLVSVGLTARAHAYSSWRPDGAPVSRAPGDQTVPVGASAGRPEVTFARGMWVVWSDGRDLATDDVDLYYTGISGSGPDTTSDGLPLCRAPGFQGDVAAAPTGFHCDSGPDIDPSDTCRVGMLVAWSDGRDAATDQTDIWATRIGQPAWPVDGIPICRQPGFQQTPVVVGDSLGGGIIAWVDRRNGDTNADVFAQRVDRYGHVLWATDGVAVATGPGWQSLLAACSDRAQGAYLSWIEGTDVHLIRLAPDGTVAAGWPAQGQVPGSPTTGERAFLVEDGVGGVVVVWDTPDPDSAGKVIPRALRFGADGSIAAGWATSGAALSGARGSRVLGDAVPDGTGGAIAVWTDARQILPGSEALWPWTDIYAQRVTGAGALAAGWDPDGVAMCTQVEEQSDPRAVSAPDGSVIAAWTDHRPRHEGIGTDADIYAMRLLADGTRPLGWPVDGLAITTAPGAQSHPTVGRWVYEAGAIIAWQDERDTGTTGVDIYAQDVTPSGTLDVPPLRVTPAKLSPSVAPNPARDGTAVTFVMPDAGRASVEVLDVSGRRVRWLGARALPAGTARWSWDGRDDAGHEVADGVYLVRVRTTSGNGSVRLVRLR